MRCPKFKQKARGSGPGQSKPSGFLSRMCIWSAYVDPRRPKILSKIPKRKTAAKAKLKPYKIH